MAWPGHASRSHKGFLVATVAVCILADIVAYAAVIPVLPSLLTEAGAQQKDLQSLTSAIITTHAASSMVFFPMAGLIADFARTRRLSIIVGLAIFTVATVAFFHGSSVTAILIAKAVQGGSSSLLWTAGLALCFDAVEAERIGTTLSVILSVNDAGALLCPPLGGIISAHWGRQSLIILCLVVLSLALGMSIIMIEEERPIHPTGMRCISQIEHLPQFESSQSLLQSDSHSTLDDEDGDNLLENSAEWTADPYTIPRTAGHLSQAAPLLFCLSKAPLLVAISVCIVPAALVGVLDATTVLEAKSLFELGPGTAGLLFIPVGFARVATGPLGGWAVDHFGPRIVGVISYSSMVPVLFLFDSLESEPRIGQIALYCALLALVGMGMSAASAVSFTAAGNIMRRYHMANPGLFGPRGPIAALYGVNLMVYSFGMALGSSMAGTLWSTIGYGNLMSILAGMSCLAALAIHFWLDEGNYSMEDQKLELDYLHKT